MLLGLFPVLGALVALVPLPVLGGAGLALFGTVAASGIRTLTRIDFSGNANLVIVALSLSMGIIPIAVPEFYDEFPSWFAVIFDSGITAAAITAVLLNIVFNIVGRSGDVEGPIFSEAPPVATISDADEERLINEVARPGRHPPLRPRPGPGHGTRRPCPRPRRPTRAPPRPPSTTTTQTKESGS